ncbi:MAG: M15 family metallopeptidase [Ruminococcus sp.]|nr:M15 family metallopeptidase [Ruminococcus sp.]
MDHLILVDSVKPVPADNAPKLVRCGEVLLEEETACNFMEMIAASRSEGIELRAFSGYRSAEYQQQLFMQSVHEYMGEGMTEAEARSLTARYIAKPGHSEHQTGLACDICHSDKDDADESFAASPEGIWLHDNACRYGFILRYPRMKEHITGIAYEPWHYRFVGKKHAEIIMRRGMTLEEYLYYYWFENSSRY